MLFLIKTKHIRASDRKLIDISRNSTHVGRRKYYLKLGEECLGVAGGIVKHRNESVKRTADDLPESRILLAKRHLTHFKQSLGSRFECRLKVYFKQEIEQYLCLLSDGLGLFCSIRKSRERTYYSLTHLMNTKQLFVCIGIAVERIACRIHIPYCLIGKASAVYLPLVNVHLKFVTLTAVNTRQGALCVADNVLALKSASSCIGCVDQLYRLELIYVATEGNEGRNIGIRQSAVKYTAIAVHISCNDGKIRVGRAAHNSPFNILADKGALFIRIRRLKNTQILAIL